MNVFGLDDKFIESRCWQVGVVSEGFKIVFQLHKKLKYFCHFVMNESQFMSKF